MHPMTLTLRWRVSPPAIRRPMQTFRYSRALLHRHGFPGRRDRSCRVEIRRITVRLTVGGAAKRTVDRLPGGAGGAPQVFAPGWGGWGESLRVFGAGSGWVGRAAPCDG